MADTTTDPDVMEVDDSNDSIHMEKNGVFDVDEGIKLTKIASNLTEAIEDDSLSNSNNDIEAEDSTINESDNKEDTVDNASDSQEGATVEPADTTAIEPEESNGTNGDGPLVENHKESDDIADENNTDNEAAPAETGVPISSVLSEKQLSNASETDSPKPSALQEILAETCPKNSPEVIVANLSPFVKDRFEISDSSKAKVEKENESNSKVDSTDNILSVNSKEKENETEPKEKPEKTKSGKKKKNKICAECELKKKLPLRIVFHGQVHQLCSELCYKNFKEKTVIAPLPKLLNENCAQCQAKIDNSPGYLPSVGEVKALCSEECLAKYHEKHSKPKNCSQCKGKVESAYNRLTWETMVFCNEDCLGKYQSFLGSHCTCCQSPVQQTSLGKYCVCFGADIRQFCSGSCLEDFKKGLKVCSFCQTDLSGGEGFLAPVGDKGQFKDFCTPRCMERYEVMNNLSKSVPDTQECCHCKKQGAFKIQVKHGDKTYSVCSDICLAGFRCSYQIMDNLCGTCFKCFKSNENENFTFTFEGFPKHFCTKACMTLFVLSNRKIIQCFHCKVKKYNFDMIERLDSNNQFQMFCSLNCLSMFRVNISATSSQKVRCDHCNKNIPAQYHLTMSDGSIRSFCNYDCVVTFQKDCLISTISTTSVTRLPNNTGTKTTTSSTTPVIANVVSLAQPRSGSSPQGQGKSRLPQYLVPVQGGQQLSVFTQPGVTPQPSNKGAQVSSSTVTSTSTLSIAPPSAGGVLREIIVRPPAPKSLRNKSASCKPIMQTKGVCVKSQTCHKAVQTDDTRMPSILPVPFPVYLPSPVIMCTRTISVPMPFPVPVPIPVPVFIKDKSSKSSESDLSNVATKSAECIKIIEESQKKFSDLSQRLSISTAKESTFPVQKETANSTFQAPKELEKSIPQATIPSENSTTQVIEKVINSQDSQLAPNAIIAPKIEPMDDDIPVEPKPRRKKRSGEDLIVNEGKRARADEEDIEVNNISLSIEDDKSVEITNSHLEDDEERLQYAFGVNAWKQWISLKNGLMDRGSSRKFKNFKTDLLQLTPSELNYSLSLFVKEVTKPNGQPYTAGALFYLLLGIQLYLSDNGRTDDLFSDETYSSFAEHFHDVLLQYEGRALAQEVPWSRIKESFLWDSRQLGAQSPQILLNTLIYFNTKYFKIRTTASHMNLNFSHIARHTDEQGSFLRYYKENNNSEVKFDENDIGRENHLIQPENSEDQLRCPVRLFEFYISKCPPGCIENDSKFYCQVAEKMSDRKKFWFSEIPLCEKLLAESFQRTKVIEEADVDIHYPQNLLEIDSRFYLAPEKNCTPDSSIWYSSVPLNRAIIAKTLQRNKLIEDLYKD